MPSVLTCRWISTRTTSSITSVRRRLSSTRSSTNVCTWLCASWPCATSSPARLRAWLRVSATNSVPASMYLFQSGVGGIRYGSSGDESSGYPGGPKNTGPRSELRGSCEVQQYLGNERGEVVTNEARRRVGHRLIGVVAADATEHQTERPSQHGRHRTVGRRSIADHHAAITEPPAHHRNRRRLRLAGDLRLSTRGRCDRGDDRTRARQDATRARIGRIRVRRDEARTA